MNYPSRVGVARSAETAGRHRPAAGSDRQVVNGMVYKILTGISWRDLPERYDSWKTVYTRLRRHAPDGVFTRALQQVQARADATGDTDWLVQTDSTIVRAHRHAAATGRACRHPDDEVAR
ncbi:transposase [Streptomyces achromogenes]